MMSSDWMRMSVIDYFFDMNDIERYTSGDTIFKAGDSDTVLYGIKEGEVDLFFNGQLLETVGANGIVGEKTLIDGKPHTTTAIARTDCKIIKLDESRFLFLIHDIPTFALDVMRTMSRRTRTLMDMAIR